jgi:hypothetical protein
MGFRLGANFWTFYHWRGCAYCNACRALWTRIDDVEFHAVDACSSYRHRLDRLAREGTRTVESLMRHKSLSLLTAGLVLLAIGMTIVTAYQLYLHLREPVIEADT